jgi:hypothetical protein
MLAAPERVQLIYEREYSSVVRQSPEELMLMA